MSLCPPSRVSSPFLFRFSLTLRNGAVQLQYGMILALFMHRRWVAAASVEAAEIHPQIQQLTPGPIAASRDPGKGRYGTPVITTNSCLDQHEFVGICLLIKPAVHITIICTYKTIPPVVIYQSNSRSN